MSSSALNITDCLREASDRKAEGNLSFRAGEWTEALVAYRSALAVLPKRVKHIPTPSLPEDEETHSADLDPADPPAQDTSDSSNPAPEETSDECAKARAVLYANIGACHVKLGDHKQAVEACTEALLDDPTYIKALQRRAASNEAIGSWSSLTSAQEDYNKLKELTPSEARAIESKLRQIKPRLEAAQKTETAEMMDKLKGLGNSLLGNFGLSTDNFKFEPNGQGGYSMNFVR